MVPNPFVGFVPLDKDFTPYRAARSGYKKKPDNGYHPPRVYTTAAKAISQSPARMCAQVVVDKIILDDKPEEDTTTGFPQ